MDNLGSNLDDIGWSGEVLYYYTIYCRNAPMGFRKAVACERYNGLRTK